MKDFDGWMQSAAQRIQNAGAAMLRGIGRTVAALALSLAVLLTFTDISLCASGIGQLTLEVAVYMLTASVMFFALESEGELCAEDTAEYKAVRRGVDDLAGAIAPEKTAALEAYCRAYTEEDLIHRRARFLSGYGYSDEEVAAYRAGKRFTHAKNRVLRRACRMRPTPLCAGALLCSRRTQSYSTLTDPSRRRFARLCTRLFPSLLTTLFTVSVAIRCKGELSPDAVIGGLLRLCTLLLIGFKGFMQGYFYVRDRVCAWLEAKRRLLGAFLSQTQASEN